MVKRFFVFGVFAAIAIATACADNPGSPTSPSASGVLTAAAGPDGATLKASAPTLVAPINSQKVDTPEVTLVVANATTEFASNVPLTYRFEIYNSAGTRIYAADSVPAGPGTTSHVVTLQLEGDQTYQWQSRAESEGMGGPWTARGFFVTETTQGYIRGNELYDPLMNGRTIGTIHGPVTFVPGLGVRLESQFSYISYELEQTLTEGEFSIITSGMPANTEGGKTKLFAMSSGYSDIVTNERRMTVEKRGDPAGVVAWRFITHGDQVDTEGAERQFVDFREERTYFWQATWRNNFFNLLIKDGGVNGGIIYDKGKGFAGRAYDPIPHVIYLGAPIGRSGPEGASVDHVTIRQVWVSSRPRPGFANR
jgi:hypothetical protein